MNNIELIEDEIISINLVGEEETIDIEVDDTHCFFVNDIYVHNSFSANSKSNGDTDMITMESINESYGKCFPADFIWTLSRNKKDKDSGTGKFFIAKNRNGPDGMVFKVLADTSTSTFRILPSDHADGDTSLTSSRVHDNVGNVLSTAPSGSAQRIYQRHKENRS